MSPSTAYALFKLGKDTYQIAAMREGRTEAEVVEALIKYREMKRAHPSHKQTVEVRPQA